MTGLAIITAVIAALVWMVWRCFANAPHAHELWPDLYDESDSRLDGMPD